MKILTLGGGTCLDHIRSVLNEEDVTGTGMPVKAGLPSVNLFYQLKKGRLCSIPQREIYFYTLGDYYTRVLTGCEPLIHKTNAAATGLYDLKTGGWNRRILLRLGMQEIHFPEIYQRQAPIVSVDDGLEMFFYPALGDQQAALLGAGFLDERGLSANFGTGAQISVLSGRLQFSRQYQTRPYFNGKYLLTIPHIPSGRALNVYFRFLRQTVRYFADISDEDLWEYIMEEAEADQAFPPLEMDMSFFTNALTDHTNGAVKGITEQNLTPGNLFYSAFRQMAESVPVLMRRFGKGKVESIFYSGGVLRKNQMLRRMISEQLGGSLKEYVAENETMKGICRFVKECG